MTARRKSAAADALAREVGRMTAAEPAEHGILPELLGFQLRRAQLRLFQHFAATLSDLDVTPGKVGLLVIVSRNPGISQAALAKAVGVERSTLGEAVERLVERGLLLREPSRRDRRSYALALSPRGERFLAELVPRLRAHEDEIAGHLSAEERATLVRLLNRLADGPDALEIV